MYSFNRPINISNIVQDHEIGEVTYSLYRLRCAYAYNSHYPGIATSSFGEM